MTVLTLHRPIAVSEAAPHEPSPQHRPLILVPPPRRGTGRRLRRRVRPLPRRSIPAGAIQPAPRAERQQSQLRLTRRGQLVMTVAVAVTTVAVALLVGSPRGLPTTTERPSTVVVPPGASLWEVAETVAPSQDTAAVVRRILAANGLSSGGDVSAGDRLVVPAQR